MIVRHDIRRGVYADSIVLMQLQSALAALPGIDDAGVVMSTPANLDLLKTNALLPEPQPDVSPDDLMIVLRAEDEKAAETALAQVDALMSRRAVESTDEFRPKSLRTALGKAPGAGWVLVSVPGSYAAGVARQAIEGGRHVFLYSDNVSLSEEIELKEMAGTRGLMVLGPDCGTAVVGGAGLGFANRVRAGGIGIVSASGTGLQSVASRVHTLGAGVSHAIGTGGRDLSEDVGATTALQSLDLLARDDATKVIVVLSKPPSPAVAARVVAAARASGKPAVVAFSGLVPPIRWVGNLHFVAGLDEAATRAVELLAMPEVPHSASPGRDGYLRALFSGGTLALEMAHAARLFLTPLASNLGVPGVDPVTAGAKSEGHVVLDLGADEFTVGRPHPMIDQDLLLRRLRQEGEDPATGVIVLDVVLGHGAHPDPAQALAPAIEEVLHREGLEVVVLLVGTDEDPQDLESQRQRFEAAGARVFEEIGTTIDYVARELEVAASPISTPIDLDSVRPPLTVINVGLESFHRSLETQGVESVQVDWRPPARGNTKLQAILDRMR